MNASKTSGDTSFRKTAAGAYEVRYKGQPIGSVRRFSMSAGQFGSKWVATLPSGKKSAHHPSRTAAADWLVRQSAT